MLSDGQFVENRVYDEHSDDEPSDEEDEDEDKAKDGNPNAVNGDGAKLTREEVNDKACEVRVREASGLTKRRWRG